jgi:hypothetical protein
VEFGEGLLNKGRAKKREKRPLTQIEIMAAVEREKQEKKAARRAAKVRASLLIETRRLPSQHETPEASRAISRDFYPSALGSFSRLARSRASLRGRKREPLFSRAAALTDSSASLSRPPPVARAGSQG